MRFVVDRPPALLAVPHGPSPPSLTLFLSLGSVYIHANASVNEMCEISWGSSENKKYNMDGTKANDLFPIGYNGNASEKVKKKNEKSARKPIYVCANWCDWCGCVPLASRV